MVPSVVTGSFLGTGAVINIEVGFLPDYVALVNQTTGRKVEWFRTQAAGAGLVGGTATGALLGAGGGGVSPFAGGTTQGQGFTVGTDAVNTAGQTIAYTLNRSGPGAK